MTNWISTENTPEAVTPIVLWLERCEGKTWFPEWQKHTLGSVEIFQVDDLNCRAVWWDDKKDCEIPVEVVRAWRYKGGYVEPKGSKRPVNAYTIVMV